MKLKNKALKMNIKLFATSILLICSFTGHSQKNSRGDRGEIIYHVFQRSFYDENGDKNGDLNGLKQKLPYLQNLGITSILLLPLYSADCYHNYFANDFETIDAEYGTMQEYISFVKEVHNRGMKLYIDMETQYVAEKHIWWKDAVANLNSPYSDYILFEDSLHFIPSTMVFDLRHLNSYDGSFIKATTVNLLNRNVLEYNMRLFAFFVDPNKDGKFDDGVDGFRFDHAMDNLDGKPSLTDLFTRFWKPLIMNLKQLNPALKNVAEQSDWNNYGFSYFEKMGVDRVFGFGLQRAILSFDKQELIKNADSILAKCPEGKAQIIFLENHDMDRFASLVPEISKQKLAAALLLLIGGIPSIYYGQEIGMKGKIGNWGNTDGNDIPRRAAFDWYTSGTGKGIATWYEHTGGWWDHHLLIANDGISAEEQLNNDSSLFNYYKKLIHIRQSNPALENGSYEHAVNENDYVFSFFRKHNKSKVLVAANLSGETQTVRFKYLNKNCRLLFGNKHSYNKTIQLNPYEVLVFKIE